MTLALQANNDGSASISVEGGDRLNLNADGTASVAAAPAHTDDSNKVPTTGWVRDKALGVDQVWRDVKPGRVAGMTYINSTNKPMQVAISAALVNSGDAIMLVIGNIFVVGSSTNSSGPTAFVTAIIPSGASYRLSSANNGNLGVGPIATWSELSE